MRRKGRGGRGEEKMWGKEDERKGLNAEVMKRKSDQKRKRKRVRGKKR